MPSIRLHQAVEALFSTADAPRASALLERDCTAEGLGIASPDALERIGAAALKLSQGSVSPLEQALELARRDWRDLLVAAGFGEDLEAHSLWLDSCGSKCR